MGYSGNYLASVVLQQAVVLAVLGFVPGLIVSAACSHHGGQDVVEHTIVSERGTQWCGVAPRRAA